MSLRAYANILLSEFSISGGSGHTDDDFIELANTSDTPVTLSGWHLCRRTHNNTKACPDPSTSIRTFTSKDSVPAHGYYLWATRKGWYATTPADSTTTDTLSENASIALFDATGNLADAVTFGSRHTLPFITTPLLSNPNIRTSHTRNLTTLLWEENAPPTPTNTHGQILTPPPSSTDPPPPSTKPPTSPEALRNIRINELFPDPSSPGDTGEYIELYNTGQETVDVSGWKLTDATKTGHYFFPSGSTLSSHQYTVITDADFSFSLNNSTETVSLFDISGTLIDSVSYTTSSPDASLNYTDTGWRLSRTRTPGSPNILSNAPPTTDEEIPKTGFKNIYALFRARGNDKDGDTLKYIWDFGDGHKSYKATTRHRYLKTGTYTVTLTTKDGTEETHSSHTLEIHRFIPPPLRIVALFPNPAGKDTAPGAEWIEIENHSKKSVDLLGYSLATGWKKLVNHPVRASFTLPKKSSRKLTRDFALFTLPNQKGKIELRAPDGTVIHSVKYTYAQSLADNTTLTKEKGKRLKIITPITPASHTHSSLPAPLKQTKKQADIPTSPASTPTTVIERDQTLKQHTSAIRLLRATTFGTPIRFSDTFLDTLSPRTHSHTEELLTTDSSPLLLLFTSLSLRLNAWINHSLFL